jgi:mRNA interferase MazF
MKPVAFSRGDVLLAEMIFSAGGGAKTRPVIVVYDFGDVDLLVLPVTSHPPRGPFDLPIQNWRGAGLLLPSTIRIEKLATIAKTTVTKKLGRVAPSDLSTLQQRLVSVFKTLSS